MFTFSGLLNTYCLAHNYLTLLNFLSSYEFSILKARYVNITVPSLKYIQIMNGYLNWSWFSGFFRRFFIYRYRFFFSTAGHIDTHQQTSIQQLSHTNTTKQTHLALTSVPCPGWGITCSKDGHIYLYLFIYLYIFIYISNLWWEGQIQGSISNILYVGHCLLAIKFVRLCVF